MTVTGGQSGQKRERDQPGLALGAQGATWVEVAEAIRLRYRVNARVAFQIWRWSGRTRLPARRTPNAPAGRRSNPYGRSPA
jgi:hypothetical protein